MWAPLTGPVGGLRRREGEAMETEGPASEAWVMEGGGRGPSWGVEEEEW